MSLNGLLTNFAASSENNDLFATLGIDWFMLAMQAAAFLVLVFVLSKFVYPIFMRIIDERQEKIDASVKAATEAQQQAAQTQDAVAGLMKKARKEAGEIVETAKQEAAAALSAAETKSKSRAEQIVADARDQISKEIMAAKKDLHNETLSLVALATEKVVGDAIDVKADDKVIAAALKGVK